MAEQKPAWKHEKRSEVLFLNEIGSVFLSRAPKNGPVKILFDILRELERYRPVYGTGEAAALDKRKNAPYHQK